MVLLLLLKMSGKGAVADAKNAMLLLKRVLLQLPKMAGCGTAEAARKGIATAKDGAISAAKKVIAAAKGGAVAAKDGWQWRSCSC